MGRGMAQGSPDRWTVIHPVQWPDTGQTARPARSNAVHMIKTRIASTAAILTFGLAALTAGITLPSASADPTNAPGPNPTAANQPAPGPNQVPPPICGSEQGPQLCVNYKGNGGFLP
jgi:hypothetical protein